MLDLKELLAQWVRLVVPMPMRTSLPCRQIQHRNCKQCVISSDLPWHKVWKLNLTCSVFSSNPKISQVDLLYFEICLPLFHVKDGAAEASRLWHPDWLTSLQPCRPSFSVCCWLNQAFFLRNQGLEKYTKCNQSAQGPNRTGNAPKLSGSIFWQFWQSVDEFRRKPQKWDFS